MKQFEKVALFAFIPALVFNVAEAASLRAQSTAVTSNLTKARGTVGLYEPGRSDYPTLSLWVESVTTGAPGDPATTSRRMDLQFTGRCFQSYCNSIYIIAEIPEAAYVADEMARTAHLFIDLADPGIRFVFGMQCSAAGGCWSIYAFPYFLDGGFADLSWSIPTERVNQGSGDATISFTDICGGRGKADVSQLDGAAAMTGYAFGYPAPSSWPGYLVFRKEKTTTRSSACGPTAMPSIDFDSGAAGVSGSTSPN